MDKPQFVSLEQCYQIIGEMQVTIKVLQGMVKEKSNKIAELEKEKNNKKE